jgi:hypothetical protein
MPEKVRIIAWFPVIVLGVLSLACIVPNYILLWREIRAKPGEKIPSMIPIIGGVFGFFAVKVFIMIKTWPNPGWSWYTLLPPALDPGCYFIPLPILLIAGKLRGRNRNTTMIVKESAMENDKRNNSRAGGSSASS